MPAKRKPLPQPCPQCGKTYGTCQFVIFNPNYYEFYTGYKRFLPYVILRIGHYNPKRYRATKKGSRSGKDWHNFQIPSSALGSKYNVQIVLRNGKRIPSCNLFSGSNMNKKSVTLRLEDDIYKKYKAEGWPRIISKRAHWPNKPE